MPFGQGSHVGSRFYRRLSRLLCVRSLSSLTPTRKKNKLPQRFAQKVKNAWLLARFARSRKIDLFQIFTEGVRAKKSQKILARARFARAQILFSICKDLSRFQDQFSVSQLKNKTKNRSRLLHTPPKLQVYSSQFTYHSNHCQSPFPTRGQSNNDIA